MKDYTEYLKDKTVRIEAMKTNFLLFYAYHFPREYKLFHIEWMRALNRWDNVFIEWFRASRKTTIVKVYISWKVIYKHTKYTVRQCFEDTNSADSVRDIAKILCSESIVNDYGMIFPLEVKKEDLAKRSLSNFETTHWVKIQSKSLWQNLRGANTFDMSQWRTERPDTLVLDDIDVLKSVLNQDIIEKNENKIISETIGAMDPTNRQIIFLWNTIFEDGVVPRMFNRYKDKDTRQCFRQPLIVDGENVRPEVFTDEVVQQLMDDWETSFNQNYMLIPYSGQWIIRRNQIHYTNLKDRYIRITIWADPASSTRKLSDPFWLVIVWETDDWYKDVISAFELKWDEKQKAYVLKFIFNLYIKYNANIIRFESVNAYSYIADDLRDLWMAVECINPSTDKVTRLMEKEGMITSGKARFVTNWEWITMLIEQLLLFPNSKHDDLVDALVYALSDSNKKFFVI